MARSIFSNKKGIGISLEDGLLTAFYWKRKRNTVKIIDSLFLSSLAIDESVTLSPEDYEGLIEFLQLYDSKSDEVIIEIPRNAVLVRHLKLPALSDQDLEQMLSYEVERHVPFSKSDIYYDSKILDRNEKEAQILLVAAKKQLVDICLDLFKTNRVKPTAIVISSFSLLNLLMAEYKSNLESTSWSPLLRHVGVIVLTASYVEISFLVNRTLESSVIIPIKEKSWQNLLRQTGEPVAKLPNETYNYLLQSFTKWMISEVDKSLLKQEFLGKGRVEKLVLIQPRLPDLELAQPFKQHLEIPIEVEDFSGIIKVKQAPRAALIRSKAGLTLKDTESEYFKLDLFPQSLAAPKPPKLHLTGVLLAMLLLLLGMIYFGKFFKERSTLQWVQEQVVTLEPEVKVITDMRNKLKGLKDRTETLIDIENQGPGILDILKELTLKTPEYAWLKEIKVVESKVKVVGYGHSKEGQTSELIRLFSDSVLLEKPSFDGAIQKIGRGDTVTFRMTMEIRNPAQPRKPSPSSTP